MTFKKNENTNQNNIIDWRHCPVKLIKMWTRPIIYIKTMGKNEFHFHNTTSGQLFAIKINHYEQGIY